jgi:methyl-accepting chemotaxis protein
VSQEAVAGSVHVQDSIADQAGGIEEVIHAWESMVNQAGGIEAVVQVQRSIADQTVKE